MKSWFLCIAYTKDVLRVNYVIDLTGNKPINFLITDITGKVLVEDIWTIDSNIVSKTINTEQLQTGIYFLQLQVQGEQFIRNFVVNK